MAGEDEVGTGAAEIPVNSSSASGTLIVSACACVDDGSGRPRSQPPSVDAVSHYSRSPPRSPPERERSADPHSRLARDRPCLLQVPSGRRAELQCVISDAAGKTIVNKR